MTDIESVGDGFIRFKNGYQICWGLELWDRMDHPSTGGGDLDSGITGGGGGPKSTSSFGSSTGTTETCGGTKTITFPVPFNVIPYIAISPASANSYQTSNNGTTNPPAAWYHNESTASFIAELYSAVKLTWIAIGKWK